MSKQMIRVRTLFSASRLKVGALDAPDELLLQFDASGAKLDADDVLDLHRVLGDWLDEQGEDDDEKEEE